MSIGIEELARGSATGCLVLGETPSWVPDSNKCMFADSLLYPAPLCRLKWLELAIEGMKAGRLNPDVPVCTNFMVNEWNTLGSYANEMAIGYLGYIDRSIRTNTWRDGVLPGSCQWCVQNYTDSSVKKTLEIINNGSGIYK